MGTSYLSCFRRVILLHFVYFSSTTKHISFSTIFLLNIYLCIIHCSSYPYNRIETSPEPRLFKPIWFHGRGVFLHGGRVGLFYPRTLGSLQRQHRKINFNSFTLLLLLRFSEELHFQWHTSHSSNVLFKDYFDCEDHKEDRSLVPSLYPLLYITALCFNLLRFAKFHSTQLYFSFSHLIIPHST